ncbi:uncharacterized protein C8A04DRAFT_10591 [Dichotomopilus funicola]|uniref:Uncharacterized protein n=1 Tax=Dichotomopilus funicola TaxID=1934379 RepID=A0AAN6V648_9PEZI|nr:hypothetical protein C8A04DRAFT_10591 [Dichotomopilus funicola]
MGNLPDQVSVADDAATIYSAAQDLDGRQLNLYKSELADCLCNHVRSLGLEVEAKENIVDVLPDLLKNFALRLGQHASSRSGNEVMCFIHKYRGEITRRFREALFKTPEGDVSLPPRKPIAKDDLEHSVQSWLSDVMNTPKRTAGKELVNSDLDGPGTPADLSWEDLLHDGEPLTVPDEQSYREITFQSPAFKWLLASLGKTSNLRPNAPDDAITRMRDKIMDAFPEAHSVSSQRPSTVYAMKFNCLWDIHRFLDHEYPELQGGRARLGEVITITGSPVDAQALSCAGYLEQTWPFTGLDVLSLLQNAVDRDGCLVIDLPDRTELTARARKDNRSLFVYVKGTVDVIAEIGEQIAWITTALSSGPMSDASEALTYCYPTITKITGYGDSKVAYLDYSTLHKQDLHGDLNGTCWRSMFRNPVVVTGYPIRRRPNDGTGLEIPLNMMAGLVQSDRLNYFLGKSYIKGFSSMLVAVYHVGGTYIWHHHSNSHGNRVSYLDAGATAIGCASPHELATARHIVGWCTKADSQAGSPLLNYNIRGSGLPHAGHDFALEKMSLSCGQIITGGCTFGIGRKDVPIHISKVGYIDRLRWISQKHVVFWDVDDKRGWMVNGSNALLHLLRGSLEHSRTDRFCSQFLFDFSKLKQGSAIDVLVHQGHRRLPVYPAKEETYTETSTSSLGTIETVTKTKTTVTTLGDRVDELYEYLEKMVDHKSQVENPKGYNAKVRLRRHLEGWDFRDLAASRDPFHLRVATLPTSAFSWVELTRVAQTITIFGKRFGELVTLSIGSTKVACPSWRSVPTGKHYLCVSLADIQSIVDDAGGDIEGSPALIGPKLAWVNTSRTCPFAACVCERRHGANILSPLATHVDPVQQLIPTSLPRRLRQAMSKGPLDLRNCGEGAVIFGQAFGFSWKWPEIGEAKTEPEPETSGGSLIPSLRHPIESSSEIPLTDTNTSGTANSDSSSRSRTGGSGSSNPLTLVTPASSRSESTQIQPPHSNAPYPAPVPSGKPLVSKPRAEPTLPGIIIGAKRLFTQTDEVGVGEEPKRKSRMRHLAFRRS